MKTLGGGWLINSKHTNANPDCRIVQKVAALKLLSLQEATGCNSIYARGRGIPHCYGVKSPPSGHEFSSPLSVIVPASARGSGPSAPANSCNPIVRAGVTAFAHLSGRAD